jgi:hypothetical protein
MSRYCWHGHGTSVHEGSPEELGQGHRVRITIKMNQLHWRNLYKPMHWHELTPAHKEHILESPIFAEEKQDDKIKARKVVGGKKQ